MKSNAYEQFIAMAADLLDEHGFPPMAGRVIGALLVCSPPHRTLDQLAEDVGASKGAISMSTQLLLRLRILERLSLPSERKSHYRLRPWFLQGLMSERTDHLLFHQRLYEAGVALLRDEPIEAKRRLIEMQAYMDFIADEIPGLNERWLARRDELARRRCKEMT